MSDPKYEIGRTFHRTLADGTEQQVTLVYTDAVEPNAVVPDEKKLDWVLSEVQAAKDLKDSDVVDLRPWEEKPDA